MQAHAGPEVDRKDGYVVIDCRTCGFRHVSPPPSDEDVERWYRDHHYTDGSRDRIDYYERDREWWRLAFGDLFEEVHRLGAGPGRTVVDVGCGTGIFLEVARERGWRGIGFEPNGTAAAHCRKKGLEIVEDVFPPSRSQAPAADLIQMRNVLEHVTDPARLLEGAKSALSAEGLLIVTVPNDYNPLQRAVREVDGYAPWWLAPPHHLNYFSFDTLEGLIRRCGFRIAGRFCSFPLDLFLVMGDNYVQDQALGRACHLKRVRFEQTMEASAQGEARRNLYRALAAAGLGREAVIFARRA